MIPSYVDKYFAKIEDAAESGSSSYMSGFESEKKTVIQ